MVKLRQLECRCGGCDGSAAAPEDGGVGGERFGGGGGLDAGGWCNCGVHRCARCGLASRTRLHLVCHVALRHRHRRRGAIRCPLCFYSTRHPACFRSHLRLGHFPPPHVKSEKHLEDPPPEAETVIKEESPVESKMYESPLPEIKVEVDDSNHHLSPCLYPCVRSHPRLGPPLQIKLEEEPPLSPGSAAKELSSNDGVQVKEEITTLPLKVEEVKVEDDSNLLRCAECQFKTRWRASIVNHVNTAHNKGGVKKKKKKRGRRGRGSGGLGGGASPPITLADGPPPPRFRLDESLNKFFCTECKYSSKRKTSIVAHVNVRHAEKFKCTQCPYTTKSRIRLTKHLAKHNSSTSSVSRRSGTKRNSHKYAQQFLKDSTDGLYKCKECEYSTKWRSSIIAHVDNYHNPNAEEYTCQQCSYKTRVKAYLQQHRVTHRLANNNDKKLKRAPRKYKQIVRDAETNVYRCSECEYSTKWRSSIIAHVDNYHNPDAEVYSCSKCSYTCKVKSYLQQHLLTHERGNTTAGRRVTGSSKYKQLAYDPARDLFTCTDCDYTSKWRGSVIAHIGLRHNSDATVYRCPHCPYSSKVKSYFVQHSRTHEAKLFKCPLCPFETKNKRTLEHHNQKEHCPPSSNGTLVTGVVQQLTGYAWDTGGGGAVQYCTAQQYDATQLIAVAQAPTITAANTTTEWSPQGVVVETDVPDINSLEPSIESSPDLTLAIEMNLNDNNLTCTSPDMTEFFPHQSYACPYCNFIAYNKDEVFRHVAYHHQQIEAIAIEEQPLEAQGSPPMDDQQQQHYITTAHPQLHQLHTLQTAQVVHNNVATAISTMHYYYTTQHGQPVPLQLNL